jgi:hypothetical protein
MKARQKLFANDAEFAASFAAMMFIDEAPPTRRRWP